MVLIEDTRQQIYDGDKHSNIHRYCERKGIQIIRQPLSYGDYAIAQEENGRLVRERGDAGLICIKKEIVVDSKKDILELASNVMSKDHRRLRDECLRSQINGSTLIFLVEEMPPCGRLDYWVSPVYRYATRYHQAGEPITRIRPELLRQALITMQQKYGCKFRFCDGRQTGKLLIEYLTGKRE